MSEIKCQHCGSSEFVTKPNWYEVYETIDGKLDFIRKESTNEKTELFCRNCSSKLDLKACEIQQ
jgi:DNA-directed RNA polymerase subunit RPC12/RpoP